MRQGIETFTHHVELGRIDRRNVTVVTGGERIVESGLYGVDARAEVVDIGRVGAGRARRRRALVETVGEPLHPGAEEVDLAFRHRWRRHRRWSARLGGCGVEAVGPRKQRFLRRTAISWLDAHDRRGRLRFDVAAVTGNRIHVVEGAF